MNKERLKLLQAQVKIGGKGTVRRKKKVVHRTATKDDKKLQSSPQKLSADMARMEERRYKVFEECNMFHTDRDIDKEYEVFEQGRCRGTHHRLRDQEVGRIRETCHEGDHGRVCDLLHHGL